AEFTVLILGDLARDSDSASINAQVRAQQRRRSMRRLDKLVGALLQRRARTEDLILVSASPPEAKRASSSIWSSLTPVLATGPDFPAGLLTSATTRTAGLVANSDLAPTILNLYHVPTPQVMEGRPISVAPMPGSANRLAILRRQDRMSRLNGSAPGPVMAPIGGFCFLSALAGIIARRRRGAAASRPFAPFMVFTQNMAAATLIAATLSTPSVLAYGIEIALLMALLTPLCYLAAQLTGRSPIVAGAIGGLALIAADTVTGQHMVKNSLFSGYALSGIRYYGVGNEFLGLTVGLGLMAAFALLDDLARNASRQVGPGAEPGEYAAGPPAAASRGPNWLIGILWVVLLFLLGWPAFGANAGSLPVCAVGFGLGWVTLRGGRVTWRNWLALVLLGILLMAAFGALDAAIWRSNGSHLASAASALQTGAGRLRLTAIAFRKMLMNLRLLVSPWLMLAAGVFAATILAARWIAGEQLTELLSVRQQTKRGLYALGAAAATALLLKDSGVVCATYLIGSACPITLYYLFTM
ncbi:MAG TPA: hypothetical protein VGS41_08105, partial [Chthonomonadales bacterium]|nr:hypothetical protein [Chthonomonadales bacterium]